MAAPINLDAYSDALVVLGTAAIVIPVVRRCGISPVLGYLAAGALLGPFALGALVRDLPLVFWFTISDPKSVSAIAELGVVFLLFLIGIELSFERLKAMRRLVFGLGGSQIALSTAAVAALLILRGRDAEFALVIGACLSLSSTAVVVEILSSQRRLASTTGRASFSVLIAQDLAVVPILLFISILGGGRGGSLAGNVAFALANAALGIAAIVVVGRLVLRPLFRFVAATGVGELFVAAALFVVIATGVAAALAGMSMALGAFVAGLLLAETEFRKAIETSIGPLKGLLLGMFFFSVGMNTDLRELARDPLLLVGSVAGLIALKFVLAAGLARLFGIATGPAVETGLLLGPVGEFAFVGIGMAVAFGLMDAKDASFGYALTSISMALIPLLAVAGRWANRRLAEPKIADPELAAAPVGGKGHAILVGYGRVGQVVADLLARHGMHYIAVDNDPAAVPQQRRKGREVYFGDATNPEFLKSCGLSDARAVIVTIAEPEAIDEIIREVRTMRPDVTIVSRARDAVHARHLYRVGVSDAVPETIEASLQLSEAALLGLGFAAGLVIASVHAKRDEFRNELQDASGGKTLRAKR
jgi:CPA2 family monovalent cation:H+ antiporter-2